MLSPTQLMRRIYSFIINLANKDRSLQHSLPFRYYSGFSLLNLDRSNYKNVGWSSPPYGSIKVNFDAAILPNKVAIDYVIRNNYGDLIQVTGKAKSLYSTSYVKIVATWIGLYDAIKILHFTNVYLEGDSIYAISSISTLPVQTNHYNSLLFDIKFWI